MAKPTYIVPSLEEWLSKFEVFSKVKVRFCETDMSGHVNNVSYLIYLEQARVEYLVDLGTFDENITAVTADIWCHYHSEAFVLEELEVGVRVSRLGNSSIDFEYCIIAAQDKRLVVTASGTVVLIDKITKKPVQIPEAVRDGIMKTTFKPQ